MANYLVLSLQTDEIIQTPTNLMDKVLVDEMKQRLNKCENFIVFVREISFGSDLENWPTVYGEIFQTLPILTPFGTCFTTRISVRFVLES